MRGDKRARGEGKEKGRHRNYANCGSVLASSGLTARGTRHRDERPRLKDGVTWNAYGSPSCLRGLSTCSTFVRR